MEITYFGRKYEVLPYLQTTTIARRETPDETIIKPLCIELARKMLEEGIIETVTEPIENDYEHKYVSARVKCLKRIEE